MNTLALTVRGKAAARRAFSVSRSPDPEEQNLGESRFSVLSGHSTAVGTRSVIEVLFIFFQKFLLQILSCLAAQKQ